VRELRRAAYVAAQLDRFLERCERTRVIGDLLAGYDLDDLSKRFTEAADKMMAAAQ
jgi:hypothetical protein